MDYLWKLQAQKELKDMETLQENNRQLILNILPDHVAKYYLGVERKHEVRGRRGRGGKREWEGTVGRGQDRDRGVEKARGDGSRGERGER